MVVGRDVQDADARRFQRVRHDPRRIQRQRNHARAVLSVQAGNQRVAGVLHAEHVLPPQKSQQRRVKLLVSGADQNILRPGADAPALVQAVPDSGTQGRQTVVVRPPEQGLPLLPPDPPRQAVPHRQREQVGRYAVLNQVNHAVPGLPDLPGNRGFGNRRRGRDRHRRMHLPLLHLRDKVAPALFGHKVALGEQLVICRHDRHHADTPCGGGTALGGQAAPGGQAPLQNIPADTAGQPVVQRASRRAGKVVQKHGVPSPVWYLVL